VRPGSKLGHQENPGSLAERAPLERSARVQANPASGKRAEKLDRIDLAILKTLRTDGRITYQALSEKVGLSARPCLERVRRLEQRGIIRGYAAILDAAALGHEVCAMTEFAMRDSSTATRQRLERLLTTHPAVVEVQVVNGEYDYVARIVAPSLLAYEEMTNEFLGDPQLGIARIHSTFVLRTLREFSGYPVQDDKARP
jgi:DNA-binding Lrp family transcriptional regulator